MVLSLPPVLLFGIIVFCGLVFGELAVRLKLPKITGYIVAGILLNPGLTGIIPRDFIAHTDLVTDIALSFITFSVGGTLLYARLKGLGKGIIWITVFEAECAFLLVFAGMALIAPFLIHSPHGATFWTYVPMALLLGALASPTDPSATLAVVHEYKAKGDVTSTVMGVAALDDATGIINFSVAMVVVQAMVLHERFSAATTIFKPLGVIIGAVAVGVIFGFLFIRVMRVIRRESEGFLIVAVFSAISLCYGVARLVGVEELMATMTMGAIVVNFSPLKEAVFSLLERYTEELVFVIFFTLSGMYLNFKVLGTSAVFVLFFVVFRIAGKVFGTRLGAAVAHSPDRVRKYTAGGLIPQGGIVIGLALLIKADPAFNAFSDVIVSMIIGTAVIHELVGPVVSRWALKQAGELGKV